MALRRFFSAVVLAAVLLAASVSSGFSAKDSPVTTSGLPVPRYVSLKSDHVNVRAGPTKDNDVAWVYTRSGLPVEIADETSSIAARLQAGVVAQVKRCAAGWCRVTGNAFDGWIEQQRLWGVYADEKVE